MTLVQFHPDDAVALRQAARALEQQRQWVDAERVSDLADRMWEARQTEIMAEAARRLDARPALGVIEGGRG